ncbi:MAG: photosynthetic reaction center cytochrome PufC [Minwuia sp.]|uniref:photosynthetic reaction center cytochrome PufC n=1 Tax=Minwuia sp. TaxID=2493630 RepID=UPI003A868120
MNFTLKICAALGVVALVTLALTSFEFPPMDSEQYGMRGVGMVEINNPESEAPKQARLANIPDVGPPMEPDGPKVGEIYENIQVLGDLTDGEFIRLMLAITQWVSPDQGCAYCHNEDNLADDSVYTKIVARQMIQMTRDINANWKDHVGATGVTCYSCHGGQPVPANVWFTNPGPKAARGMAARSGGQNIAGIGTTSMHYDPFGPLLKDDGEVRVAATAPLPTGKGGASIQATEQTYSLMVHMSEALGVNCGYCHNSRAFSDWSQSRPQRITAWHGINMVQALNNTHLEPLTGTFPPERLGPGGDVAKVNCATCHQGVFKPLYGEAMAEGFPSLQE